ncbi:hypothetical protein GTA08_BOTSDO03635 [Neofusicoccum parvum]|uniref:Uncharacterized protein n=1 Tax=Neofusicoccum parvum TaxID=310453 RepID=A0ACB5S068_9PEZI|nr:hypothetical protein GTA08_BOTSDO03635 [Neofusicoccum parvum]
MTCNITAAPLDIEPLPLYQPDPETSSLLSSAPSYTSEAPTYRSSEHQQQQPQPQPYYITTSLLDISTPPPRTRNTANPPRPAAAANNDDNARPTSPRATGLPAATTYAPGFTSRAAVPDTPDAQLLQSNYNIGAWSSVTHSHARRQYERVAMRRASRAAGIGRTSALVESMKMGGENPPMPSSGSGTSSRASTPPLPLASSPVEGQVGGAGDGGSVGMDNNGVSGVGLALPAAVGEAAATAAASSTSSFASAEPVLPLEDPALVGEAAATRARQQRLYREACLRHEDNTRLVQESKSWDFMLSQMADWYVYPVLLMSTLVLRDP